MPKSIENKLTPIILLIFSLSSTMAGAESNDSETVQQKPISKKLFATLNTEATGPRNAYLANPSEWEVKQQPGLLIGGGFRLKNTQSSFFEGGLDFELRPYQATSGTATIYTQGRTLLGRFAAVQSWNSFRLKARANPILWQDKTYLANDFSQVELTKNSTNSDIAFWPLIHPSETLKDLFLRGLNPAVEVTWQATKQFEIDSIYFVNSKKLYLGATYEF